MDKSIVPPIDTSPENLAYINSLKPGEEVIECGQSCMTGTRGIVYLNKDRPSTVCVKWDLGNGKWMGTSVTWGTRRLSDVPENERPKNRAKWVDIP